jgi:hypothetical protein
MRADPRNSRLAAHECLHPIQLAGDQTEEIREFGRESDAGDFLAAFRNVVFSIRDIELVPMTPVGVMTSYWITAL